MYSELNFILESWLKVKTNNLKEAIKTSSKFKLNSAIVDTIEIDTAFIDDIQFTLEN